VTLIGFGLIAASVPLWFYEPFLQYFWEDRSRSWLADRLGPKDTQRAKAGVRGSLAGAR
jgi:hypothetical protein